VGPVVISEIMYNPGATDSSAAEYIELLNVSGTPVALYDAAKGKAWRISDGIEFEFPSSAPVTMAPGERIVITKSLSAFNAAYGTAAPDGVKVFEWTAGSLDNGGETVQLDRPGALDDLNVQQYVRVDRVNYDDVLPWPASADGAGPSLTRVRENEYGNDFINWVAATPTPGAASAQASADADGDGMPDAYENANGLDPADPNDAVLDADGDGQSNLAEYTAGTDPRNPEDAFRISLSINGGTPGITFNAAAGRAYTVQYKLSLAEGPWLTLREIPEQAVDGPVQITDTGGLNATQRFYRIVIPRQP
jgi:hypothetical protein